MLAALLTVSQSEPRFYNTCHFYIGAEVQSEIVDILSYNISLLKTATYVKTICLSVASHTDSLILSTHQFVEPVPCIRCFSAHVDDFPQHFSRASSIHADNSSSQLPAPSLLPVPQASSQLRPFPQRHILPRLVKPTAPSPMRLPRLHRVDCHVSYLPPCITLDNKARLTLVRLTRFLTIDYCSDDFACVTVVL